MISYMFKNILRQIIIAASTYGYKVFSPFNSSYFHIDNLEEILTEHLFLFMMVKGRETRLIGRLLMFFTLKIIFFYPILVEIVF